MEGLKTAGMMYIGAGALFCISAIIGGNFLMLPLGAVMFILGLRKIKESKEQ